MTRALDEWQCDFAERAKDPTFVRVLRSTTLADDEAQFTNRIVDGFGDYFICKPFDCAFVCPAADWIRDATPRQRSHFCCPLCGLRYYLWRLCGGRSLANKLFVIRADLDGLLSTTSPKADPGSVVAKHAMGSISACTGDNMVFPMVWADTATTSVTNKVNNITLKLTTELEAMPPWERIDKVTPTVADMGHPAFFKHDSLPETARVRMEAQKTKGAEAGHTDLWRYDHILGASPEYTFRRISGGRPSRWRT